MRKSLFPYLLLAAGLHLWLLSQLRPSLPTGFSQNLPSDVPLSVQFAPAATPPTRPVPPPSWPAPLASTAQPQTAPKEASATINQLPTPAPPIPAQPAPSPEIRSANSPLPQATLPSYQRLLEAARKDARQNSEISPDPPPDYPSLGDRPVLPQLAKQLAAPPQHKPDVATYADGSSKVTTAYGTVYCTPVTQHLPLNGPVNPAEMVMTCP